MWLKADLPSSPQLSKDVMHHGPLMASHIHFRTPMKSAVTRGGRLILEHRCRSSQLLSWTGGARTHPTLKAVFVTCPMPSYLSSTVKTLLQLPTLATHAESWNWSLISALLHRRALFGTKKLLGKGRIHIYDLLHAVVDGWWGGWDYTKNNI